MPQHQGMQDHMQHHMQPLQPQQQQLGHLERQAPWPQEPPYEAQPPPYEAQAPPYEAQPPPYEANFFQPLQNQQPLAPGAVPPTRPVSSEAMVPNWTYDAPRSSLAPPPVPNAPLQRGPPPPQAGMMPPGQQPLAPSEMMSQPCVNDSRMLEASANPLHLPTSSMPLADPVTLPMTVPAPGGRSHSPLAPSMSMPFGQSQPVVATPMYGDTSADHGCGGACQANFMATVSGPGTRVAQQHQGSDPLAAYLDGDLFVEPTEPMDGGAFIDTLPSDEPNLVQSTSMQHMHLQPTQQDSQQYMVKNTFIESPDPQANTDELTRIKANRYASVPSQLATMSPGFQQDMAAPEDIPRVGTYTESSSHEQAAGPVFTRFTACSSVPEPALLHPVEVSSLSSSTAAFAEGYQQPHQANYRSASQDQRPPPGLAEFASVGLDRDRGLSSLRYDLMSQPPEYRTEDSIDTSAMGGRSLPSGGVVVKNTFIEAADDFMGASSSHSRFRSEPAPLPVAAQDFGSGIGGVSAPSSSAALAAALPSGGTSVATGPTVPAVSIPAKSGNMAAGQPPLGGVMASLLEILRTPGMGVGAGPKASKPPAPKIQRVEEETELTPTQDALPTVVEITRDTPAPGTGAAEQQQPPPGIAEPPQPSQTMQQQLQPRKQSMGSQHGEAQPAAVLEEEDDGDMWVAGDASQSLEIDHSAFVVKNTFIEPAGSDEIKNDQMRRGFQSEPPKRVTKEDLEAEAAQWKAALAGGNGAWVEAAGSPLVPGAPLAPNAAASQKPPGGTGAQPCSSALSDNLVKAAREILLSGAAVEGAVPQRNPPPGPPPAVPPPPLMAANAPGLPRAEVVGEAAAASSAAAGASGPAAAIGREDWRMNEPAYIATKTGDNTRRLSAAKFQ